MIKCNKAKEKEKRVDKDDLDPFDNSAMKYCEECKAQGKKLGKESNIYCCICMAGGNVAFYNHGLLG